MCQTLKNREKIMVFEGCWGKKEGSENDSWMTHLSDVAVLFY